LPDEGAWYKICQHLVAPSEDGASRDGNDVHHSLPAIQLLRENSIRLRCLPPSCTHKLQPLDVGVFGALDGMLRAYISVRKGVAQEKHWCMLVKQAYKRWELDAAFKGEHIAKATFRKAGGIVPF